MPVPPPPLQPASGILQRLLAPEDGPWRQVFESGPWGAALLGPDGAVLLANAALAALAGASDHALLAGHDFIALFAPAQQADLRAALARAMAGHPAGPPVVADLPPTPDAEQAAAAMVSFTAVRDGQAPPAGVIARVADVTAQRRLEQQLAQAQKMQAIGQLAGGIAHDFNNLLTAILLTADEAAGRPGLAPDVASDLAQIRRSGERGAALVRKLLAFGRKQTMQARVIVLNDAIEEVSMLLRRLLGARVSLVLDLDPPRRAVRIDPTQFDQVIVNLAVNARDAMPQGGRLTLRTGQITLLRPLVRGRETVPPGRYAMVEVEDTGTGIPETHLDRIFEPFFTTKKDGAGTGLGLATVWGIVRQMDGFVAVDSTPGEGTTFRVYLPRVDLVVEEEAQAASLGWAAARPPGHAAPLPVAALPATPILAAAPARPSRGTLLLAEDEDAIRRLAARALARDGWEVLEASCGETAIALIAARATPLDAVVTDMVMPGADGEAVVRAARARWPDLPVVITSGYAEGFGAEGPERLGVAWLAKPYSTRDLAATTARLLAPPAASAPAATGGAHPSPVPARP